MSDKRQDSFQINFRKELYSKVALIKASYNFSDKAYIHLDADDEYYYVSLQPKDSLTCISEQQFMNEMLAQSVRHEVYQQTKNIRELILARAMATSVVIDEEEEAEIDRQFSFSENEILKDWFVDHENDKTQ